MRSVDQPVKVLHIIDHLSEGGRERRMVELLKGISKSGLFDIVAVVLKRNVHYTEIFELPNVKVTVLERKTRRDPRIFFSLFQLSKEFNPDIIHTWSSMSSLYVIPIIKWLKIKFINGMISNAKCVPMSNNHIRSKITFPFSDLILANSLAGARVYNAPEKKSRVIPNGFSFDRIQHIGTREDMMKKFNITTKYVIGMVGSVDHRKDYKTYVSAAIDVLSQKNDITFLIIGTGDQMLYIKDMVPGKFSDRILFLGRQKNVESIINIFDIGVLTTYTEGISNAVMEYMALGKPVIVTEGGGTEEIVLNNRTGFIIDHASKSQLIDKIHYLLENPSDAKSMGLMGKKRITEEFNIQKMVNTTIDLYKDLLKDIAN